MSRFAGIALAVLSLFAAVTAATAETYPSRTITIIVPFPAGGPTDTTAREVANALAMKFKQSVIVENVTGGGTIIATTKVARANPDGYTLLVHNIQISANVTRSVRGTAPPRGRGSPCRAAAGCARARRRWGRA